MKKVFKIIFVFYIFALIIYLVFIGVHRLSIDKSIFGYRVFTMNDNSMSPKYKFNDIIITKDYDSSKLKVGDDIAYLGNCCGQGGMIVNHEIIKINEEANKITTKGINLDKEDPEINYKQVIGKIIGILPVINFIHHIIKNQIGFIFVIVLPLVIAIIILIIETIKDIKIDKLEKDGIIDKEMKEDKEIL